MPRKDAASAAAGDDEGEKTALENSAEPEPLNSSRKQVKSRKSFLDRTLYKVVPKQNIIAAIFASIVLYFTIGDSADLVYDKVIYGPPKGWNKKAEPEEANFTMELSFPHTHTTYLDTIHFYPHVINASEDKIFLVVFYDPWSKEYRELGSEINEFAKTLRQQPYYDPDRVEVCMVNSGINNYLLRLYGSEQTDNRLWQEDPEAAAYSYRFGKQNYFPMIISVFKGGSKINVYADKIVNTKRLIAYTHHHLDDFRTINEIKELHEFHSTHTQVFELCEPLPEECSKNLLENYLNITNSFRGQGFFVVVTDQEICYKACSLSLYRNGYIRSITNPSFEEIQRFIQIGRVHYLEEAQIEKTTEYRDSIGHLCLVLVDSNTKGQVDALEDLLFYPKENITARHDVMFSWANVHVYGEGFGVNISDTPALVYLDMIDLKYLVQKNLQMSSDEILRWLENSIEDPDVHLTPYIEESELSKNKDGEKNMPEKKVDENMLPREEEIIKVLNIPWYNQIYSETTYKHQSFERLWAAVRRLRLDYMRLEEYYAQLTKEEKLKEKPLRVNLNRVRRYLEHDKEASKVKFIMNYLPATPEKLKRDLSSEENRKRLFRMVERYAAKHVLFENKYELEGGGEEFQQLAKLANFLHQVVVEAQYERSEELRNSPEFKSGQQGPNKTEIDRRDAHKLSYEEFLTNYAIKGVPVVITNLTLFAKEITEDYICEMCGEKLATLKYTKGEHVWGGLSNVPERIKLETFIKGFRTNETMKKFYLHDWSLPNECPEILGLKTGFDEYRVPKYFAGDYFQRMPYNDYEHGWPSMFIGGKGTESKVHIDSGGTNFWLYLISGEKKWRIFDKLSIPNMYMKPASQHFHVDPFHPDINEFPLFTKVKMYEFIQRPGDLVFVPSDSPHAVYNTQDIIGISSNYMDDTNHVRYLWYSAHEDDFRRFELYTNSHFPKGVDLEQKDVSFGEFKSKNWFQEKYRKYIVE